MSTEYAGEAGAKTRIGDFVTSLNRLLPSGAKMGTKGGPPQVHRGREGQMASAVHTMLREVMDIRQASEYLGISGDTLYRYASEGFIPAFKLGNRWRFKRSLLDAWMVEKSGARAESGNVSVMPKQKKPMGRAR